MKKITRAFLTIGMSSLALSLFAVSLLGNTIEKVKAETETSADWNLPASATTSDYGSYYSGITGKQGMTLKDQLTDLIDGHTVVSYDGLYDLYHTSDNRPEDNTVFDMYGDFHYNHGKTCGSYKNEGDCFNREHSVPKSWFNEKSPMYSDAHHLYPTDGKVNGMRSNFAYGEVSSASYTYSFKNQTVGITGTNKKGTSKRSSLYNGTVFEPADCYKGDFARTYFYFATRYKSIMGSMSGNGTAHFTASTTYCNLTQYSKELFLDWHRADPVSKKEIVRNNAIYARQRNRNPFIDHPEYVEAIWGDTPLGGGSVALSASKLSMTYGGSTKQLTATSSDNSQITWTNTNSAIASLSATVSASGATITVTPLSVGSTSITATATINGVNYSSSCTVVVSKEVRELGYVGEPDKLEYIEGESFDPTGLEVTATYTDDSYEDVTDNVVWTPNPLTEGTTFVTGTYAGFSIKIYGITVAHDDSSATREIDFTTNTQITTSDTDIAQFAHDPVTFTIEKNTASVNANNYCPPSRFVTRAYNNQRVTISAGGARISSITITCTSNSNATGYSGGSWTNATCELDGSEITVTPTNPLLDVSCIPSKTVEMSSATIQIGGGGSTKVLEGISTTGQTETYKAGNIFSYDGICTAHYSDDSSKVVTPVVDSSDVNMSIPGIYTVGLEYTEGLITVSDCYDITVEAQDDTGFVNSIEQIYSKAKGDSVSNVYGLYVGSVNNGQSAILMNGEYGIMLYGKCETSWVENETYIKVTASTLDIYFSLYELKSCTCEVITNTAVINENVAPVVTYEITGQESTSDLTIANRLSLMSGVVTNIEYRDDKVYYDGWKDSKDNRVVMNVHGHSIYLFIKGNDASNTLGTKIKASLNNESEITVQGFSSFFSPDFQVQFKGIVDPDPLYLAEDFAQDLLNLTNGACNNSFNNDWGSVYSTLAPIWVTLEGADYFAKLPAAQKQILKNTVANENGSTLEEAMARYDHICLRYTNLTNFIQRASASSSTNKLTPFNSNNAAIFIVLGTISTLSTLGAFILLKKKKHN